ncbi:MAG: alpha/beta hydrolase [Bacteroidetes bacterium]|nr:MAG: alpha/beta hydrolase [Bacteroidota bacterium]
MQVQPHPGQYANINGLQLYYEIHGDGYPLILIHGGGSTIESTYGRILPELAKKYRIIAVELQAHGRTKDIDRPLTFEQDADDVAALCAQLKINKAHFMGFSNGGTTCLQIAIRHPNLVNKLILASSIFKRQGMQPGFFEGMDHASLDQMPQPLKDAFLKVNLDRNGLLAMFRRDVARMVSFRDIPDPAIHGIQAPAFVLNGDKDVVRSAHAMELAQLLPHAQLAILPSGHGDYIGESCTPTPESNLPNLVVEMIDSFLK